MTKSSSAGAVSSPRPRLDTAYLKDSFGTSATPLRGFGEQGFDQVFETAIRFFAAGTTLRK